MKNLFALVLMLGCWVNLSYAVIESYEFEDETLRKRYQSFSEELRCPKCQNQNLADSNSPIAADLRRELYRLLHEGRSDQEIISYMTDRYGDFILYRPPLRQETAVLWFGPLLMIVFGAAVVMLVVRSQRRRSATSESQALSPQEQQRLAAIMREADDKEGDS